MTRKPTTPPQEPPPPDAVALYVRWQAAKERTAELKTTLPPVGETVAGGVVIPIQDPRVVEAVAAESAAALAFYRHEWWFGSFSKSKAEAAVEMAVQELRRRS